MSNVSPNSKAEADLARVEEETGKCAPDIMESVSKDVKTTGRAYDDVFRKLSRTTLNDIRRTVEALRLHIKTQGSEKTRQVLLQHQEVHPTDPLYLILLLEAALEGKTHLDALARHLVHDEEGAQAKIAPVKCVERAIVKVYEIIPVIECKYQ